MKKNNYTLFVDGASRGNPGHASIGCSLLDDQETEIFSISERIGIKTNNQAEYTAWIRGLEKALEMGVLKLTVKSDSELIIRQLQGRYKVKNKDLEPMFQRVKNLISQFGSIDLQHVPRAQNARADELANLALDAE